MPTETKETKKATGRSPQRRKETTIPKTSQQESESRTDPPPKSVSFQIRTAPSIKALAERVASDHEIGGRSKLDAEIYRRGLLLTILLLGPGPDGSYSGLSEQDLARQLQALFDRQYALLDKHQFLSSYVYRVLPHGGIGSLAFLEPTQAKLPTQEEPAAENNHQEHYRLSDNAQTSLENFAEEI